MRRAYDERKRTRRAHMLHLRQNHHWPRQEVNCECEWQAGRFRKAHPTGCGHARCHLCHYEKIYSIPSHKDRIREQRAMDEEQRQHDVHTQSFADDGLPAVAIRILGLLPANSRINVEMSKALVTVEVRIWGGGVMRTQAPRSEDDINPTQIAEGLMAEILAKLEAGWLDKKI